MTSFSRRPPNLHPPPQVFHRFHLQQVPVTYNLFGNATDGTIGDETILHQATKLASHSVEYAKSVVGLGGHKATDSVEDATENKQGGVTLGGLVKESRDLAANVLHAVQGVVVGGAQQAKETAHEGADQAEPQGKGVVQKVRDVAASPVGAAENIIATGAKKVEKGADELSNSSTQDLKNKASNAYDSAAKPAYNTADDLSKKADSAASDVSKKVGQKTK